MPRARFLLGPALLAGALVPAGGGVAGQAAVERCAPAERFLVERTGLVAVTEPDTIDDWRSGRRLPGCRITSAGLTSDDLGDEAGRFFEDLQAAGWSRTPNPADAPGEASLRFRREETDCVFNVYSGGMVITEAELEVNTEVVPGPGEVRYNVLVLCMPAVDPPAGDGPLPW